ncbi:UvrABC system protein C [Methanothermobacter sp. MT-2]|nr:UvrABC system protein C [Methanothermobacter sp. MT-2]HHW04995.1 excinuclease ABC subunit UvrC [Methanothermobacter sp.]HOK72499.1 excinuclease ABC subunit UvrC [Methanothermobacter sp.]HPQ03986.1 excinuclease ABC subunit UvrC [Methanothermobacter sp.]HPU37392.1 excinuclease ABC subunit UvrC [Methanothermobacter sp.]
MAVAVEKVEDLPDKIGVYILKDGKGNILYIGKSISLRKRVKSYFQATDNPKIKAMRKHLDHIEYILTDTEKEALILESNLIKKYRPPYNVQLKDDKRYPYIKITREEYPRITITRRITSDGSYLGPLTNTFAAKKMIKFLKSLFKIRDCKVMDGPCLNKQLGLCHSPCAGNISREEYMQIIRKVELFFQGQYKDIITELKKEMEEAASKLEFEKAALLRDQIASLREVMEREKTTFALGIEKDVIAAKLDDEKASIIILHIKDGKITGKDDFTMNNTKEEPEEKILSAFIQQYYSTPHQIPEEILIEHNTKSKKLLEEWLSDIKGVKVKIRKPKKGKDLKFLKIARENIKLSKRKSETHSILSELKRQLKLPTYPRRIEGYDISNISGKTPVGSMVTFIDGKPAKGLYRQYKIHTRGPDDYAMIREIIKRRYLKDEVKADLIIIDGGLGQLNSALQVLESLNIKIPIIGIAKKDERIYTPYSTNPIYLPRNSKILHLIEHVRDEAHRFAIKYHRKLRDRKSKTSTLDKIKGIGPKRKKNLLKHFDGVEAIKNATIKELSQVDGINKKIAERIHKHFQKKDLMRRP